jgi:Glyoxalase/Bleomycin resistance protein/Dioxygenase superfamily
MLEGQHYQNAYITRDIDKAMASFAARAGVSDARSFEASVEVTTPKGRGLATNKLSFIWINNLQYELIQPVSGLVDIYTDVLPADDSMLFHHICMRVDDWSSFRPKVERQKYPVVLEGGGEALRFLYLDARDFLGHYLEYVWMIPERWTQLGGK